MITLVESLIFDAEQIFVDFSNEVTILLRDLKMLPLPVEESSDSLAWPKALHKWISMDIFTFISYLLFSSHTLCPAKLFSSTPVSSSH